MCINARGAVSTATLGLMALIWDGLHEEERAVLVLLQVLNKVGRSLEGVIHRRVERGDRPSECTFRANMNKRKMFLDLNESAPERATWVGAARNGKALRRLRVRQI